jgi:hypothetical protein
MGTEISELYFFCKTSHTKKKKKLFLSWKTRNPDILKVAWNGDQGGLKLKSWKREATPIVPADPIY